jgi:hypothetical protein
LIVLVIISREPDPRVRLSSRSGSELELGKEALNAVEGLFDVAH